jgi:hypothetical protein
MTEPISQMLWSFFHEIPTFHLFVKHLLSLYLFILYPGLLCNPSEKGYNLRVALELCILNPIQWGFVDSLEAQVSTT